MALTGIKVIEFGSSGPGSFCGMVLADFGASVLRIDEIGVNVNDDKLANGKMSIAINLKSEEAVNIVKKLCKKADVLIDTFKSSVMESLGIGPNVLLQENPRLIFVRLTEFGDNGCYSAKAGHDINCLAISGLLSTFGRYGEKPIAPINLAADYAGGGLICVLGILIALLERELSNLGQVIDCNILEGAAYIGSWMYRAQNLFLWKNPRGKNRLDTGVHFYETYETKDGKFLTVSATELQFYKNLLKGLKLSEKEVPFTHDFEKSKIIFSRKFLEKTQAEWCKIFDDKDACVMPILSLTEAPKHPHSVERKSYSINSEGLFVPNPAPKLKRTPATSQSSKPAPKRGQHTDSVLRNLGYTTSEITELQNRNLVEQYCIEQKSKL